MRNGWSLNKVTIQPEAVERGGLSLSLSVIGVYFSTFREFCQESAQALTFARRVRVVLYEKGRRICSIIRIRGPFSFFRFRSLENEASGINSAASINAQLVPLLSIRFYGPFFCPLPFLGQGVER